MLGHCLLTVEAAAHAQFAGCNSALLTVPSESVTRSSAEIY
jgi:hypothetical protein